MCMFTCSPWTGNFLEFTPSSPLDQNHAAVSHLLTCCEKKKQPTQLPSWLPNCWHSSLWLNHNNFVICLFQTEWGDLHLKEVCCHAILFLSFLSQVSSVFFSVHYLYIPSLLQLCWDQRASLQPPFGMLCCPHHQDTLCNKYLGYEEND
jgi:hypothetical protein